MTSEVAIRYADVEEVAEITGLSKSTLNRMRCYTPEASPPFSRIGRRVIYPLAGQNGLYAWIDRRLAAR